MPEPAARRRDDTFVDAHGVTIHYSKWCADQPTAIVQVVHGVGEYGLRYEPLARDLVDAGYSVAVADLRGHGRTGLGQYDGDHSRLGRLGPGGVPATIAGIRQLSGILRDARPGLPLVLLGHSLGSIFAQMILDLGADDYDAVVLSGTAYRTLRHMNGGDLAKRHRLPGGTGTEWLTRDTAIAAAFAVDPLTFDAKVQQLFGVREAARLLGTPRRLARDVPILIQIGSDDTLGGPASVARLVAAYERRRATDVRAIVYEGARHEVYNETNRDEVIADLVAWLDEHLRPSPGEPEASGTAD